MQRVSPVTVPTITFPTLSDDTNNWIRVAQTATYTQQERAKLGTIFILGSHLRRICKHGDDETGWWFDDTIISVYLQLLQLRAGAKVRALSMVATSVIIHGDFETAAEEF